MSEYNTYPTMDAVHLREYQHTGYIISHATIILGVDDNSSMLDDDLKAAALCEEKLKLFFYKIHKPKATDPELFLPTTFSVEDALRAADKISKGNVPVTEIEKFISAHTGPLILEVSDIYFYRAAKSFAVQVWYIDTDLYFNSSLDHLIKTGLANEYIKPRLSNDNLAHTECTMKANEDGMMWDEDGDLWLAEPGQEFEIIDL